MTFLFPLPKTSELLLATLCGTLFLNAGCKSRDFNANNQENNQGSDISSTTTPAAIEEFYKGLDAPPGSAARKRAGLLFEQEVLGKALAALPTATDADAKRWQQNTLKIFKLTAEYLQKSAGCTQAQKVRLYRGHGFNAERQADGKTFQTQLSNAWYSAKKTSPKTLTDLPWKNWLAADREFVTPEGGDTLIQPDYRFDQLAIAHTIDSKTSALVSTTTSKNVAKQFGTEMFVLDVCPERTFPVMDLRYMSEFEFYVPLFLLPEEIVADVPHTFPIPSTVPAQSALTSQMWTCFANTGTEVDISAIKIEESTVRESGGDDTQAGLSYVQRYKKTRDSVYKALTSTKDFAAWRADFAGIASKCTIDCALADATLKEEQTRAMALGSRYSAEEKADLKSLLDARKKGCGK